jgi:enamine deaminase RidA (YjgF/YER057c/UK114 family)
MAPERRHISSGSAFEERAGYARAVVDGDWVFVSGTTGFDYPTGQIDPDPVAQTRQCFANIEAALAEAGCGLADMVRVRIHVADRDVFEAVADTIGDICRQARPANTTVVSALVDPRMKIEIEVTAKRSAS